MRSPVPPALIAILLATTARADPPEIVAARIDGTTVRVTLAHPDTGWDHYADGWRVELADGTVLATRDLLHPHVEEQPFTRSLGGLTIPEGVTEVFIRARDNTAGWADTTMPLPLD